ncbi:MAG TPA: hypothetical protein VET48_00395, partial [Steroidobacteraceae bacterium]|nr:hypothetical protein [Steroidobacteraceae bacterium]
RELLRSYIKQQAVISADRAAITVPYNTEQKLWGALAEMPPFTAPVAESVSTLARGGAVATSVFIKIASTAVVAIVLGFVGGYFFGNRSANESVVLQPSVNSSSNNFGTTQSASSLAANGSEIKNNSGIVPGNRMHRSKMQQTATTNLALSEAPLTNEPEQQVHALVNSDLTVAESAVSFASVPETPVSLPNAHSMVRDPNNAQVNRPRFWNTDEIPPHRDPSILDRLEFSTHVGIGKQFPNSAATNISMPYFTNSDVTAKYMIVPQLWIGAATGYANMNQKHLKVSLIHPNDPSAGQQVDFDYVHEKTGWIGGVMEYRLPVSSRMMIALDGGIAASGLGAIYSSELGARYEVTDHVGVLGGIRISEVGSNAAKQLADIRNSGTGKLGIINGADAETPNYNVEFSTGFYFRF